MGANKKKIFIRIIRGQKFFSRYCKIVVMKFLVLDLLGIYKAFVSPFLPPACRFEPSCSEYAREAVDKYGVIRGTWMGLTRILRCQPFCKGGHDPVR